MNNPKETFRAHPNFQYFHDNHIALNRELCLPYWEKLRELLRNHNDIDVQLAEIATYVEVLLDGHYERHDLMGVLCRRMQRMRMEAETIHVDSPVESLIWLPPEIKR